MKTSYSALLLAASLSMCGCDAAKITKNFLGVYTTTDRNCPESLSFSQDEATLILKEINNQKETVTKFPFQNFNTEVQGPGCDTSSLVSQCEARKITADDSSITDETLFIQYTNVFGYKQKQVFVIARTNYVLNTIKQELYVNFGKNHQCIYKRNI